MKCPECDGRGYLEELLSTKYLGKFPQYKTIECSVCHGKGEINAFKPMTNEEWFCNLPTEEKAKVLYNFFMARTFCQICPENNVCDIGYKCKYRSGEVEDFVEWLKEQHQ